MCFCSLLILTLLNLGLFFKLWAMEDVAHRMYLSTKHRLRERAESRWDCLKGGFLQLSGSFTWSFFMYRSESSGTWLAVVGFAIVQQNFVCWLLSVCSKSNWILTSPSVVPVSTYIYQCKTIKVQLEPHRSTVSSNDTTVVLRLNSPLFFSVSPDLGPRQSAPHRTYEDMHLLRAVLQDSINLLEQVNL